MPRLNQIIAIEKGIKNESNVAITAAYHEIQKSEAFSGISRTYRPVDEDGEKFPAEHKKVQRRGADILKLTSELMTKYWDITVTKDAANTTAKGDVVVDGHTLLKDVPVTSLLFLEKQLVDLATMVKKIPVLDPGDNWKHDATQDCYAADQSTTHKTKKVPKSFVSVAATKEHPAQAQVFTEDVVVGYWDTIKYSGAMPQDQITALLGRIGKLQAAVKFAREEANTISVTERHVGQDVFKYLLG
jgi:hypothetical protein